jgi:thioredoxin reductase
MRRIAATVAGSFLMLTVAAPVMASPPSGETVTFTTDPYVIAECDGYDVVEQDDVSMRIRDFVDRTGAVVREVTHATDTGVIWRSDTGVQVATYADAGGTFTSRADGTFTWTGVHNRWTLTDGTVIKDRGRVVVAQVAPGDFERIFEAGKIPEIDPCTW